MRNTIIAAVKTYVASAIGIFLGLFTLAGIGVGEGINDIPDFTDLAVIGRLGVASFIAAFPALLTFIQNYLKIGPVAQYPISGKDVENLDELSTTDNPPSSTTNP